jgi:hypothetical protein
VKESADHGKISIEDVPLLSRMSAGVNLDGESKIRKPINTVITRRIGGKQKAAIQKRQ